MTLIDYLTHQHPKKQEEIWKRLTVFLSNRELEDVMSRVEQGIDLYTAHNELGLVNKYQVEIMKILEIVNRRN